MHHLERRDRYSRAAKHPIPTETPRPTTIAMIAATTPALTKAAMAQTTETESPPSTDARKATPSAAGPTRVTTACKNAPNLWTSLMSKVRKPAAPLPSHRRQLQFRPGHFAPRLKLDFFGALPWLNLLFKHRWRQREIPCRSRLLKRTLRFFAAFPHEDANAAIGVSLLRAVESYCRKLAAIGRELQFGNRYLRVELGN